ncbi:MAG: IS66 family transposase [Gammaproteobacteria bacterium]|nr:IS66 family transposase [Gammaproteobacteria bacterium]
MQAKSQTRYSYSELEALVVELQKEVNLLREKNRLLLHRQFAAKSEQMTDDQLSLFNDDSVTAESTPTKMKNDNIVVLAYHRKKRQRLTFSDDLPKRRVEIDLDEHDKTCDCCNTQLTQIGEDITRKIEFIPAKVQVVEYARLKYACKSCEDTIKRPPLPNFILPKSFATPSLLAHLIVSKFGDGLPLYRIQQQLARQGVHLPRSTMSTLLLKAADLLVPIYKLMIKQVLSGPRIWTDDTILPKQNDDPNRKKIIQSRLWVYIGGPLKDPPLVIFDYTSNRSSKWPKDLLAHYQGYKHADGYGGYKSLHVTGSIHYVACWSHARRKFFEASQLTEQSGKAKTMIKYIKQLYRIETACEKYGNKKRKRFRRRYATPILNTIKAYAEQHAPLIPPKTSLGKAFTYLLNQWHGLVRYLDAGHLTIDNNLAEQHIRPIAVGRKSFLFVGSDRGGRAAAIYYSLLASCNSLGVNPYAYLVAVFERLPECLSDQDFQKLMLKQ